MDEIKQYWRENVSNELSAEKAANLLVNKFNYFHRKIAQVIAEERAKLIKN